MRITPVFLALAAVLVHCATLNPVAANDCGNGVVEANEDCDSTDPAQKCGAPSAGVQACHFVCSTTADCKAGSCSAAGICRRPAGTFASLTTGVSANVSTLLAGDFDGDRHIDLIGSPPYGSAGSSRVHFFDDDSALATTTPLDLPIPLGVVKDIDGDGLDDLGFAIRNLGFGAFGALKGGKDRTFATELFPALTIASTKAKWTTVTNGPNVKLPGSAPACAFGLLDGATQNGPPVRVSSICNGSTGGAGTFNLGVSFTPDQLVGDPQAGMVDHQSTCGELVFATSTAVYLVPLCANELWLDGPGATPRVLQPPLAEGESIASMYVGAVRSLDSDDVLLRTTRGATWVYGDKLLKFEAPAAGLSAAPSLPLASGDLNGDRLVDFVFPNGITLAVVSLSVLDAGAPTTDGGVTLAAQPRAGLTWKYAKIGRFNDDDLPDVLTSFDGQLDVDVMGNSGDGRFTPFTVRSDGIVRGIGAGDFDGDRIEDVAFLQSTSADDKDPADLFIAFGSPTGAPEPAHLVGTLKSAHGLASLADSAIGVDDLAVVSQTAAGDAAVTVLFGTGGRTQVAPLFMVEAPSGNTGTGTTTTGNPGAVAGGLHVGADQAEHFWQPTSFSIGPFVNAGPLQIVSLAAGFDYTPGTNGAAGTYGKSDTAAWFAGHDANAVGGLDPFRYAQGLGPFVSVDQTALVTGKIQLQMVTASGDVDYPVPPPGEIDELVTLTKAVLDPTAAVVYLVRPGIVTVPAQVAKIPNASVAGSDPIQIVDLTGDHLPDIAFILTADGARKLMIQRGDGKGNFDAPTTVAVPDDAVTFAPIDTGKSHLELAVVTPTKLLLASLDGVTDLSPIPAANKPSFTGVTVGDFNGDGVQDIALAESGTIRLLPQNFVGER